MAKFKPGDKVRGRDYLEGSFSIVVSKEEYIQAVHRVHGTQTNFNLLYVKFNSFIKGTSEGHPAYGCDYEEYYTLFKEKKRDFFIENFDAHE